MGRSACIACLVALAACGSGPLDPGDAGPSDAPVARDAAAFAPTLPAPPTLTPCPAGWREVADPSGTTVCDPWPAGGRRPDCAPDAAHFPGAPGCERIGPACAPSGWPEDVPSGRAIVYVDDDAPGGGDGTTRATAFASLAAAVAAAAPGSVVAVAAGRYTEPVALRAPGVTLWGACVAETVLTAGATSYAVVSLLADGTEVRNVAIEEARNGVHSQAAATRAESVVVRGTTGDAIVAFGGALTIRRSAIRDAAPPPPSTEPRYGATAVARGTLTIEGLVIAKAGEAALFAFGAGATIDARDVAVNDTVGHGSTREGGYAAWARAGGAIRLERFVSERARTVGLAARDGSRLEAIDAVVREMLPQVTDGADGHAADARLRATVSLARTLIDGAVGAGVWASTTSSLALRDVLLARTEPGPDGTSGIAIVLGEASLELDRVEIVAAHEAGIVTMDRAEISGRDLIVRSSVPDEADPTSGVGIWIFAPATTVELERLLVEDTHLVGVAALPGTSVTLRDARIASVHESACASTTCPERVGGIGLLASSATLWATRFAVEDAALCGVVVDDASMLFDASMDLSQGVVARAPVGACVQVDGFDAARLRMDVDYRDVDIALQATSYDLPQTL